jgi:hypothetical protein
MDARHVRAIRHHWTRCLPILREGLVRGLIGVVHLGALPGDPGAAPDASFALVLTAARADAEALVRGGVHGQS